MRTHCCMVTARNAEARAKLRLITQRILTTPSYAYVRNTTSSNDGIGGKVEFMKADVTLNDEIWLEMCAK